jgi:hypothetical protein
VASESCDDDCKIYKTATRAKSRWALLDLDVESEGTEDEVLDGEDDEVLAVADGEDESVLGEGEPDSKTMPLLVIAAVGWSVVPCGVRSFNTGVGRSRRSAALLKVIKAFSLEQLRS